MAFTLRADAAGARAHMARLTAQIVISARFNNPETRPAPESCYVVVLWDE